MGPARLILVISILALGLPAHFAFGYVSATKAKTMARFSGQCDNGSGKACYDYGRLLWGLGGSNRKKALHYFNRGCHLEYKLACDTYRQVRTRFAHKDQPNAQAGAICFSGNQLTTARFTPNPVSSTATLGQKVDLIKPGSFWDRVGLKENDVVVKVNNMPFNNQKEVLRAFSASGKKFGFEVRRGGLTITLWYSCE